jgi:tetratricopeptide (TPR) repeat protein
LRVRVRRLKLLAPPDAYTQGQIAALVSAPTSTVPAARTRVVAPAPPAAAKAEGPLTRLVLAAAAVFLGIVCIWWAKRPRVDLMNASDTERAHAKAVVDLLRKGSMIVEAPRRAGDGEGSSLQRALEKGALLEKEQGATRAIAHYREALAATALPVEKGVLLLAIAELAEKSGDRAGSLSALDEAIALGGPSGEKARFTKAELLEGAHDEDGARRLFGELQSSADPEMQRKAKLRLGMSADRAGDVQRALAVYEEVLARYPATLEADGARLGAAALYRAAGRKEDAKRMYADVLKTAAPGSDFEKSAQQGLKTLE